MFRAYSGTSLENFVVAYDPATGIFDKRKLPKSWYKEVYVCLSLDLEKDNLYMIAQSSTWAAGHYLRQHSELIVISGLVEIKDLALEKLAGMDIQKTSPLLLISALGENSYLCRPEFKIDRAYTFKNNVERVDNLPAFHHTIAQAAGVVQ